VRELINAKKLKESNHFIEQKLFPHEDIVVAFDVLKNLCLSGINGGKVFVWDLKFLEIRL
jgi:hypothetical protein